LITLRQHQCQAPATIVGYAVAAREAVVIEGERTIQAQLGRRRCKAGEEAAQQREDRMRCVGGGCEREFQPTLHRFERRQRMQRCGQRAAQAAMRQHAQAGAVKVEAQQPIERHARLAAKQARRRRIATEPHAGPALDGRERRLRIRIGRRRFDALDGNHVRPHCRCSSSVMAVMTVR